MVNSSHTDLSEMFFGCTNLTTINNIDQWDTSNVTDMHGMLYNCANLTTLDVSNFDTNNVTYMNHMFYGCTNLTTLDVSNFNTSNVITMNQMFYNCTGLTSLDLSNFDTSNVTNFTAMFQNCTSLHTIRLDNCSNDTISKIITSSYFPTDAIEGVTRKIYVNPDNIEGLTAPTNWVFVDSDGNEIVPDEGGSDEQGYTPYEYRQKTDITEVDTMVTAKNTSLDEMFKGCTNLKTINNINQWDTSNVTTMSAMFHSCSNLYSLDLSNFNTSNVTTMWGMFHSCTSLEILDLSGFDISDSTNVDDMLSNCNNLHELTLYGCSNITIGKIIGSSEFPTGQIFLGETEDEEGNIIDDWIDRTIIVDEELIGTLSLPDGWTYYEEIPVCEHCGEEGCDGSCRYCPECGELLEECTCESEEPEEVTAHVIATFNTTESVKIMGEPNNYWLSSYDEGNTWESNSNTTRGNEVVYLRPEDVNDVKIYRLFEGCSYLTDATFIDFSNASFNPNSDNMFNGCVSLESLDLNSLNLDDFNNVDMMFNGCDNLRELHLEGCSDVTIDKIITSEGFPTNAIEGVTRKIYCTEENAAGLTPPTNWVFVDSDGNEIVQGEE